MSPSFKFEKKEYEVTDDIIRKGLKVIIDKNIDNLNYAKKVWIAEIEDSKEDKVKSSTSVDEVKEWINQ